MTVYNRQIQTAKKLIAKKGQSVLWRQKTIVDNPDQPWLPGSDIVEFRVSIVFLTFSAQNKSFLRYFSDTNVPTGSLMGLMAAVPFSFDLNDTVIRDGKVLNISTIDTLSPDGTPILHTIAFEK